MKAEGGEEEFSVNVSFDEKMNGNQESCSRSVAKKENGENLRTGRPEHLSRKVDPAAIKPAAKANYNNELQKCCRITLQGIVRSR